MTVWAYSSPSLLRNHWAPDTPMPRKETASRPGFPKNLLAGWPLGEASKVHPTLFLPRNSEETPGVPPAPAHDVRAAHIDDLFDKTLSRLQLGPGGDAGQGGAEARSASPKGRASSKGRAGSNGQSRQSSGRSGTRGSSKGQGRPQKDETEQCVADPAHGWVQKVLATGPSESERRQDLLDLVDTTMDPRTPPGEKETLLQPPRRSTSRTGARASVTGTRASVISARRVSCRAPSKPLGPRLSMRSKSKPSHLSSFGSSDEDEAGSSQQRTALPGSLPIGCPPSPFKRSTSEALKGGNTKEVTQVFNSLAVDFEIESTELVQALMDLGHRRPRVEWVEELLEKSYGGRSYLDKPEFAELVDAYRSQFQDDISDKYRSSDLSTSGSISMLDLSNMMRSENITPLPGMVRELFNELTRGGGAGFAGTGAAGLEEYLRIYDIVHERGGFTRLALLRLHGTFRRFDADQDGILDGAQLRAALHWLGLDAFNDEIPEVPAKDETKDDEEAPDGPFIAQTDFLQIVSRCHEREVSAVKTAFSGRDASMTGSVNMKDLPAIFEDLGYLAVTPQVCKEACAACNSQDASTQLGPASPSGDSQPMMMRRMVSGWGRARMAIFTAEKSEDNRPTLVQIMDSPTTSSLQWRKIPRDLLFEDFYAVVERVRDTHCLSCTERAEAAEAFNLHCAPHPQAQSLSLVEMTSAIRWIGYPVRLGRLLEILDETDKDDTYRRRDAQDFMRLVARVRADEVHVVRKRLKKGPLSCTCGGNQDSEPSAHCDRCLSEYHGCGLLPASSLGIVLGDLGHYPSWEQVSRLVEDSGGQDAKVPLWDVLQLLDSHRRETRGALRSNLGFSEGEVKRFQQRFQRLEQSGCVKRRELAVVAEELVGKKRRCKRISAIARDVLFKTDPSQSSEARQGPSPSSTSPPSPSRQRSGSLQPASPAHAGSQAHSGDAGRRTSVSGRSVDFPEFLRIMRLIFDQDDEERLERERDVVKEVGFSREEVKEFRRLFHQASFDAEKRLAVPELEKLIARVMPLTAAMTQEFKEMATMVTRVGEEEALDFGNFLTVMRTLLDRNWHNINEASETLLAAAAKAEAASRSESRAESKVSVRAESKVSVMSKGWSKLSVSKLSMMAKG